MDDSIYVSLNVVKQNNVAVQLEVYKPSDISGINISNMFVSIIATIRKLHFLL